MDKPKLDPLDGAQAKKPYEKPQVASHRVFEASLACVKMPGSPLCQFNFRRLRS